MTEWGTIPDWLNVVIALLALLAFMFVERDRFLGKLHNRGVDIGRSENSPFSPGKGNLLSTPVEYNVDLRAELYSRILVGAMFALAFGPLFSWAFHGLVPASKYSNTYVPYAIEMEAKSTVALVFAVVLSVLLSLVYLRSSPGWVSVFVHWVERLAFSLIAFWVMVWMTYTFCCEYGAYGIHYDSGANIVLSVLMFLLIAFPSTPIDWIIHWIKTRERKTKAMP